MNKVYSIALTILIFIIANTLSAEERMDFNGHLKSSGLEGKEFVIGFMQNEVERIDKDYNLTLVFCITSPYSDNVIEVKNNMNGITDTIKLNRNQSEVVEAADEMENDEISLVRRKTFTITSKYPILVYCYNIFSQSMDSYAALPVSQWGTEYTAFSMPLDDYEFTTSPQPFHFVKRKGQVMVMGQYDNTIVTLRPTVDLDDGTLAGSSSQFRLNKGQNYLIEPASITKGEGDLTGLKIESTSPVGVLSGHTRSATNFSTYPRALTKDHLVEMLLPHNTWRQKYYTIPFYSGKLDDIPHTYYKVVASEPNTTVTALSGGFPDNFVLNPGEHAFIKNYEDPVIWEGDKPFSVMQIMARNEINMNQNYGDPSFLNALLSEPTSNYLYFFVPRFVSGNNQLEFSDRIGIILSNNAINFLKYNGTLISDTYDYQRIDDKYSYVVIRAETGINTLSSEVGVFSANVYGTNPAVSYAHNLTGASNTTPASPSEIIADSESECFEFEVDFTANSDGQTIGFRWAEVIEKSLVNIEYDLEYTTFGNLVSLSGRLLDKSRNGYIEVELVNEFGGSYTWSKSINGLRTGFPKSFDFGNYSQGDSICVSDYIKNSNDFPITIQNIDFPDGSRLQVKPDDLVGRVINPQETVFIAYCLVGSDTSDEPLLDSVVYDFGCSQLTQAISGSKQTLDTRIVAERFDKVRVGDNQCGKITFTNNGNVPNTIDSIFYDESKGFVIDTIGLFPLNLEPDARLDVAFCFIPSDTGYVEVEVAASNLLEIELIDTLSGTGVEPQFQSYSFDMGEVRTGTSASHTFPIDNLGTYEGNLVLVSVNASAKMEIFDGTNIDDLGPVYPNTPFDKNVVFTPELPIDYSIEYTLVVDPDYSDVWNHDTVRYTFSGRGIEPTVSSFDYDLGTFVVSEEHIDIYDIFGFEGSDEVVITSVNVLNSHNMSAADLQLFTGSRHTNASISNEISYNAIDVVDGFLELELISDAGYGRTLQRDTTTFSASAEPYPSIDISARILTEDITSCIEGSYRLELSTSNDAEIRSISIQNECNGLTVPDGPYGFENGGFQLELPIHSNNETYCEDFLNIALTVDTVVANRSITLDTVIQLPFVIDPVIPLLTVDYELLLEEQDEDEFEMELPIIGGVAKILYSINFEHNLKLLTEESISFSLVYDYTLLNPLETNVMINVGSKTHQVPFTHQDGLMTFDLPSELLITSGAEDITFTQEYLVLLTSYLFSDMELKVDISDCFEPQLSTYRLNIREVCDFHLRTVKFLSNLTSVNVHYDAQDNTMRIDSESDFNDRAQLKIYNLVGKSTKIIDINLPVGKFSQHIPLVSMPNGVYFVEIWTSTGTETRQLLITN